MVADSCVGLSRYGGPARLREHRPQPLVEQLGEPVEPPDHEHRTYVEVRSLLRPLLGDPVDGVLLLLGHGVDITFHGRYITFHGN